LSENLAAFGLPSSSTPNSTTAEMELAAAAW
jgi:hypothetical protein